MRKRLGQPQQALADYGARQYSKYIAKAVPRWNGFWIIHYISRYS